MLSLYWIFLGIFFLERIAEIILEVINNRYLTQRIDTIPSAFKELLSQEKYSKSQSYTRDKSLFGIWSGLFDSLLLVLFIYGGILDIFHSWILGLSSSLILQGLLFMSLLTLATQILNIPWSLYHQFHLEEKYGFNSMTTGTWIGDFFKGLLVNLVMLSILLTVALWIYQSSPRLWWLWIWGFFTLFSLFTMFISPYIIEPLFNKYKPLYDPDLEDRVKSMLSRAGIQVNRVQVMDASRRSRHSNAYFTGIGPVKRIVFYDTLLQQMDQDEVLAILAHEAGHWKKGHIKRRLIITILSSLLLFYFSFRIIDGGWLNSIFSITQPGILSSLVLLSFLYPLAGFFLEPIQSWFSRKQEREADNFALSIAPRPEALSTALVKLAVENLSNLTPHPAYSGWYYSHPPVLERIDWIKKRLENAV